jgi:fructose-bisphosphate aldolase class I
MLGDLPAMAAVMVSDGRGILAVDESVATMNTRLGNAGVAQTEAQRRAYREMLISTPGLSRWISGIIMSDDIFCARVDNGRTFPDACRDAGLLPGIKVDTGAKPLAGTTGEVVTEGLDNLRARLATYADLGARFTKWRAVIRISGNTPSRCALRANAHALARYASLVQEAGLVPIVEPEVLMDGDHSIEQCAHVTEATLRTIFDELVEHGVRVEGIVLKPNMVIGGAESREPADIDHVAIATVRVLRRTVPAAVPGIAFLSGGQGVELATAHLGAMNRLGPHPWELSFSFGRALVDPALRAWGGDPLKVAAGQEALAARAQANAEARAMARHMALEPLLV